MKRLLFTFFFLMSIITPNQALSKIDDVGIIDPETGVTGGFVGFYCELSDVCSFPNTQNVEELEQWTEKIAYSYQMGGIGFCTQTTSVYLKILIDSSYVLVDDTTPIKLVSGNNPHSRVLGQNLASCDAEQQTASLWYLEANSGSCGEIYTLKAEVTLVQYGWETWTVTVADCEEPIIISKDTVLPITFFDIYNEPSGYLFLDLSLLYWFIGVIVILLVINYFKKS